MLLSVPGADIPWLACHYLDIWPWRIGRRAEYIVTLVWWFGHILEPSSLGQIKFGAWCLKQTLCIYLWEHVRCLQVAFGGVSPKSMNTQRLLGTATSGRRNSMSKMPGSTEPIAHMQTFCCQQRCRQQGYRTPPIFLASLFLLNSRMCTACYHLPLICRHNRKAMIMWQPSEMPRGSKAARTYVDRQGGSQLPTKT